MKNERLSQLMQDQMLKQMILITMIQFNNNKFKLIVHLNVNLK